jgi:acetolactate synthase-1/2/3 large subunit
VQRRGREHAADPPPLPHAGGGAGPGGGGGGTGAARGGRAPGDDRRSSVWWDDAPDALRAFVERAQISPTSMARGRTAPPDHPMPFQHTRKDALTGADVVFVVGTRSTSAPTTAPSRPSARRRRSSGGHRRHRGGPEPPVDVGIVADSRSALAGLRCRREGHLTAYIRARASSRRSSPRCRVDPGDAVPIHHYRLAKDFGRRQPGSAIRCSSPTAELGGPRGEGAPLSGRWLDPGPLGCLGVGALLALAAKLLHRSARSGWCRGRLVRPEG